MTHADSKGEWKMKFPKLKAGGPYTLIVQGNYNPEN